MRNRLLHLIPLGLSACFVYSAWAQTARPAQIFATIDENQLVVLKGNTLPIANPETDLGQVSPGLPMSDLVLVLCRSGEQQAAFDAFVASQYDPTSPDFHQWIAPEQVGERFGPSLVDVATISNWLNSHGFVVNGVSKDRMAIHFGGTAAEVQKTFHTEIHNLQVNGRVHIANMSDPEIPAALAPVVAGVKSLNDFHPRPLHRLGNEVEFDSSTGIWRRVPDDTSKIPADSASPTSTEVHPNFGIVVTTQSGSYPIEDVSPYDFATMYNVLPLWNANIDGTGQTIAIVATSDINSADVANYRNLFGLPTGPALKTIIANGVDPGQCTASAGSAACTIDDLYENTLDAELSGAVAKGAQIDLVVSGPTSPVSDPIYSSASYITENNTAKILNVSYGECELFLGTSGNTAYNNLWETAAAEGIGVFVATGDSGSPACDQALENYVPYGAQDGLAVSGVASSPYVTAVGGTDLTWCNPGINSSGYTVGCSTTTPYWYGSNNSTTGASAANYITEVPWNNSCATPQGTAYLVSLASFLGVSGVKDAETACNFVVNNYISINQKYGINLAGFVTSAGGGGGGASNCTANSTTATTTSPNPASCSGGYPKPAWQAGVTGIPSDGKRDIPDVSFFAGNGMWDSATLVCVSEAGACLSSKNITSDPTAQEVGGTSVSSPEMAGVMALINQKAGSPQGNPNAQLYTLATRQTYSNCSAQSVTTSTSCYFNDVDTGTIATPCKAGALNCTISHSGDAWGLLSGFSAATGYDEATGLGSLNVANIVNGWSSPGGTATATVTAMPSQNAISIDQGLTVKVTVAGSSGIPTGNVALVSGGYVGNAGAVSSGSYTFTIPAYSLAAGTDTLTISYVGDATYAETSTTTSVTVNQLKPAVSVTPTPSTVGANTTLSISIAVTGTGPTPTGTIQLSGGGASGNCTLVNGGCSVTVPSNSLTSGTDTFTAAYSGDKDYAAANGTATEVVNTLTPIVKVTPSLSNLDTATSMQITVTVSGTGVTPTGTVQINGLSNYFQNSGTLANGTYSFSVSPRQLLPGADTLTVAYEGDGTYVPVTATTMVTVSKATLPVTATPSATSIYTNTMLTISGSVGTTQYPSGSVTASSGGSVVGSGCVYCGALDYGLFSIRIQPGSLSVGTDTLTVAYSGDDFYNPASTTLTVTVAQWTKVAPTITVTPQSNSIDTGQSFSVQGTVSGSYGAPTGSVTLTSGGSTWGPASVYSDGTYSLYLSQNQLSAGSDTLTANYTGDATYLASSGSAVVTVTQSVFSISASATSPASIPKGSSASLTITISTSTNYSGKVSLTCAKTGGPTNQSGDDPGISLPSGYTGLPEIETVTVTTVAATSSALVRPPVSGGNRGLAGAAALALLILFWIPGRRRNWRQMLGVLVLLVATFGVSSCGGSGSGSGSGGGSGGGGNPGTATGTYTYTVTATGNPAVTPAPTTTFTVTVN